MKSLLPSLQDEEQRHLASLIQKKVAQYADDRFDYDDIAPVFAASKSNERFALHKLLEERLKPLYKPVTPESATNSKPGKILRIRTRACPSVVLPDKTSKMFWFRILCSKVARRLAAISHLYRTKNLDEGT